MERSSARAPFLAVAGRAAGLVLSLLMLWSGAAVALSAAATAAASAVRVGVVLDLASDVGSESLACISTALDDFHLQHPSGATPVELSVRDSRGEVVAAAHAVEDLIKNAQVQAIILGPQTSSEADTIANLDPHDRIPILTFAGFSPTSCAFWLEDPVTASRGHGKIGFTLENESIIFLDPETGRRNARELETSKLRKNCETVLRIAVPHKQGFESFVKVSHPNSRRQKVTGFCIDVFETAMGNLEPPPCYEFFAFNGSYDELVGNVSSGVYNGAAGDVTITAERVTRTDFTVPYAESGVSVLVLAEDKPEMIQWTFLMPLTGQLWLATVAGFFYIGFVVWITERRTNQEFRGPRLRQLTNTFYFAFSTLTFSHGIETIKSPLTKAAVVMWCFLVLILVQSYTASLSSILTAKRLRPLVTDLNQLRLSDEFVGYQDGSFVRSMLISHGIRENRLRNYTNKEEYADALRKGSKNGGVSAMVDEIPYLTSFLSDPRYQNDFRMSGCIYKTPGFAFAFKLGDPLVHSLSAAILNLTGGDDDSQIETKWFGTAPLSVGAGTVPETNPAPLTLRSVSGLFIITGSVSTLVLLISIVRLVRDKCNDGGSGDEDPSTLIRPVPGNGDQITSDSDNHAVLDQLFPEILDNNSQRDGQSCPLQPVCMLSDSGPAPKPNQIEMRTVLDNRQSSAEA